MAPFTRLLMIPIIVLSCSSEQTGPEPVDRDQLLEDVAANADSTMTEGSKYYFENTQVKFEDPIVLMSSPNIAIPIILEEEYEEKGIPDFTYFNIAIVDESNSIKRLLFDESVIIDNITTFEECAEHEYEGEALTYYHDEEYDRRYSNHFDGLLFFEVYEYENREKDYSRLFVYNLITDSLFQLSFDHTEVTSWYIIDNQPRMIINYRVDSNRDGIFNEHDDENMIITDPRQPQNAKPLFDVDLLKTIKIDVANKNQLKLEN